jgi:hypothetical protein
MKWMFSITLLASFSAVLAQFGDNQDASADAAVMFLADSKPISRLMIQYIQDPKSKAEASALFAKQMEAISVITQARKDVDIDTLFRYLASTADLHLEHRHPGFHLDSPTEKQMDAVKARYPVFSLILVMPNAAASLEKYALDHSKNIDLRLDAFCMLTYLDKKRLKNAGEKLTTEIGNGSSIMNQDGIVRFIVNVEDGKQGFDHCVTFH